MDEQTCQKEKERVSKLEIYMEIVKKDIEEIKESVKEIMEKLDRNFVSKTEFWPVKTLVYGIVGLMLVALVGALITSVIK